MDDFLKENPDLSPSKLLQSKIIEVHEKDKIGIAKIRNIQKKLNFMAGLADERLEIIDKLQNELDLEKKRD